MDNVQNCDSYHIQFTLVTHSRNLCTKILRMRNRIGLHASMTCTQAEERDLLEAKKNSDFYNRRQ
jgi:hypothetical protein